MTALSTCFLFGVFVGEIDWEGWIGGGFFILLVGMLVLCVLSCSLEKEKRKKLIAQLSEGIKYFYGSTGTEKKPGEAVRLVRDALNKGVEKLVEESEDTKGMTALGLIYLKGIGVDKDSEKAELWFREAVTTEARQARETSDD